MTNCLISIVSAASHNSPRSPPDVERETPDRESPGRKKGRPKKKKETKKKVKQKEGKPVKAKKRKKIVSFSTVSAGFVITL